MRKKEHLRKILKVDRGDLSYAEMDTEVKSYNKFINRLKVDFFNKDADEIFVKLYKESVTLDSITAKSRGKQYLEDKLMEFGKNQKDFYKEIMYPSFIEEALKRYSISDADIARIEHEYKHSIILTNNTQDIFCLDRFLSYFIEGWNEFNGYIDKTLQLIFNDYYNQDNFKMLNISQFEELVEEAIKEYTKIKENHQEYKEQIQKENPYCNLYMYCRNTYILNYFELHLPNDSLFKEYKNFNIPLIKKTVYSLRDIAENYNILIDANPLLLSKAYGKIKKNFQGSTYMQKYKNTDGEYVFSNLSIPLAYYIYYRKKNRNAEQDKDCFENNVIIEGRIAPILNAKINHDDERLKAAYKYLGFIQTEFKDIFSTLNNRYQNKMIGFLNETIVNLFYRSFGLSRQVVYGSYYK